MTLSPNSLSAEPAATPGNLFTGFGVPTQSPGAAPATTLFASILTQADALGSNGATPVGATAPAGTTAPSLLSANTPGSTPGVFFLPPGEPLAEPSVVPDAASEIAGESPPTAGSQPPASNTQVPYLGFNYTPSGKAQPGTVVAFAPVSVPTDGLVGQQVGASVQVGIAGKKTVATQEPSPAEKQNTPTKSPEAGSDNSGQNALQLAYQFIAGQWVPQPMPESVVEKQAATANLDMQSSAPISAVTSSVASGQPSSIDGRSASEPVKQMFAQNGVVAAPTLLPAQIGQASLAVASGSKQPEKEQRAEQPASKPISQAPAQNGMVTAPALISTQVAQALLSANSDSGLPEPKQRVGQSGSEQVSPVSDQNRVATAPAAIPAQVGQQVLSSTIGSVLPKGSVCASAPVEPNGRSEDSAQKESPADTSPLAPESQTGVASSVDLSAATPGVGMQTSLWRLSQGQPVQFQAQEKIAAPGQQGATELASGVYPSSGVKEKKPVVNGSKELTSTTPNIGTDTANRENAMPHSAVNKAPAVVLPSLVDDGIRAGSGSAVVQTTVASVAAQATKLVQEIRQIADRISVIDRNTVEVRFDFSDADRLSVRVEYRDGAVHTTFRTDSSQLRDAISQEWQAQSAVTEQKSYRMTEPVFSQTTSDRQTFGSAGGGDGSGRQRAFEQASQSGTPSYASTSRNTGSTTSTAAPTARFSRPDNSLHLHVLA